MEIIFLFSDQIVKIISTAGEKKLLGADEILGEVFNCYRELQEILRGKNPRHFCLI